MFDSFFSIGIARDPLLWLQHDPWLVLLSVVVSMGASAVALHMAALARDAQHEGGRRLALVSGSLALGSGVWTMHYIGMLAFAVCGAGRFDPLITVLSVIPSLGASWVALRQLIREQISLSTLLGSGVLVGAGIGTMHYVGMEASSVAGSMRYDLPMFLLSIVVAVLLAMLALWVRFGLARPLQRRQGLLTACAGMVMGTAIAGMHYTGMAALRFVDPIEELLRESGGATVQTPLSVAIAIVTIALSLLVLAVNGGMRYRQMFLQIQRNERLQRAILDTAADAVVMFDGEGTIRSFNSGARHIFGWREAEVLGRNFAILLPPEDRQHKIGTFIRGIRTPQQRIQADDIDIRGLTREGREFPARLSLGRVESDDEQWFIAFISDLSVRQAMELALRRSEQQLRTLLDNLPGIAYRRQLALPGLMEFVSDGVAELSGYGAEDFLGGQINWQILVHPDELASAAAEILHHAEQGRTYQLEYRVVSASGEMRWVSDRGRGVSDEEGRLRWVDGMMFDISERRAMEQALREAKARAELAAEARANFLANMSHEIRTPMNAIIGFSEALLETPLERDQHRQLSTVLQSGRSLLRLLNDILDTAKLDKGAVVLEKTDFSLRRLCAQVIDTLSISAERKGLQLELAYPPAVAEFYLGDSLRVQQILLNLLGNAIKFTERGRVVLRVETGAPGVVLSVEDSGIGMSVEQTQRIFDPFAQADASTSRRFGGTGLGTTIARQLVELMGGRIGVSSTPGEGSVFRVSLPLQAGQAPVGSKPSALPDLPAGLRILAVDDIDANLELLQLNLGRDQQLSFAHGGREAVERCGRQEFDLVLMDLQMPGMDGFEAARQIHAEAQAQARPRVPIIALSASVLADDRERAGAAGMGGFATKPLEPAMLRAEIARVLGIELQAGVERAVGVTAGADTVIDWEAARRLWQDQASLEARLCRFAATEAGLEHGLGRLLERDDWTALSAEAHRVKGVAANLGLRALERALGELELAARSAEGVDRHSSCAVLVAKLPGLWIQFEQALDAAGIALAVDVVDDVSTMPPLRIDETVRPRVLAAMRRAAACLEQGELPEEALAVLSELLGETQLRSVAQAVDGFDFQQAQTELQRLAEQLGFDEGE